MKNSLAILLLLIYSASQFGSQLSDFAVPVIHTICYGKVFKRRSNGATDQMLVLDSLTYRRSLTEEHEIKLDGELFDIISVTTKGHKVQLQVTKDEYETHLVNIIEQIREAVKKTTGNHSSVKALQSWLLKLYYPEGENATLYCPSGITSTFSCCIIPGLQTGIHKRYLQPPDSFISEKGQRS